jgi:hypothetical protein
MKPARTGTILLVCAALAAAALTLTLALTRPTPMAGTIHEFESGMPIFGEAGHHLVEERGHFAYVYTAVIPPETRSFLILRDPDEQHHPRSALLGLSLWDKPDAVCAMAMKQAYVLVRIAAGTAVDGERFTAWFTAALQRGNASASFGGRAVRVRKTQTPDGPMLLVGLDE